MHRVTTAELADAFGLTPRRISQLVGEGLPRLPHGGHDLAVCCRWYTDKLRTGAKLKASELSQARARLASAQADRQELALAVERGELVNATEVRAHNFSATRLCRDHLLGIPDRLSAVIAGTTSESEVHELMTTEIRLALTQLAEKLRSVADGVEGKPMS